MKNEKDIDTGNPVSVVYYGDVLDDGDTSEVMVELIIGMDKDTVSSFVPGEENKGSDDDDDDEDSKSSNSASKMTGIVIEYTEGGKLILENEEDGIYYYFETEGARVKDPDAIVPGEEITVDYTGDVYGNEIVSASKLTLKSEDSGKDEKTEEDEETDEEDEEETDRKKKGSASVKGESITGKIKTMTQNTVTIETESGTRYKFSIMDAEIEPDNGLKKGMEITLYYDGDLEDGAESVEVKRVEEV